MLNKSSIESAAQYSAVLASKNISLYAIGGTPLANLVQTTRAAGSQQIIDITRPDFRLQEYLDSVLYMANTKDKLLEGSPHDFAMDELLAVLSTSVAGHFSNVRNKIKPDIISFVEEVNAVLAATDNEDISKKFEVKVWRPIAPIANGTIAPYYEVCLGNTTSLPSRVKLDVRLPDFTDVQIKETMLTLNPAADIDIVEWMAAKGSVFFTNVWENVFQVKENTPWHTLGDVFDTEDGADYALAIFLLANKLHDNPPEGTNMSLSAFNASMLDYRNQAAQYLDVYNRRYELTNSAGILVKNITDRTVVVFETVYKQWIDKGGRNEALFGLALRDGVRDFNALNINENAQMYLDEWARFVSGARVANKLNKFTITREALLSVFVKQFSPNDALLRAFKSMVNEINEKDIDNMWNLSKHLICNTVYCATDSEVILDDFEAISAESPDMDAREVAALVMLKYITRWIASQISVSA